MRYSYTQALVQLKLFAELQGFEVDLKHSGVSQVSWKSRTVNTPYMLLIEGSQPVELRVYVMLHELGHHELRKDWVRFGVLLPVSHEAERLPRSKLRRRQSYFVAGLEEEYMAWDEGLLLAERFGIRVNRQKWDEFRSRCLMSYIKFYSTLKK